MGKGLASETLYAQYKLDLDQRVLDLTAEYNGLQDDQRAASHFEMMVAGREARREARALLLARFPLYYPLRSYRHLQPL